MSRATSATTGRRYGLKRVCGTWERSRSALYARRARFGVMARRAAGRRPHCRMRSCWRPFAGPGPLPVPGRGPSQGPRAAADPRPDPTRVLRVMRTQGLLSPHRGRQGEMKAHDGTIVTSAPDVMWGTAGVHRGRRLGLDLRGGGPLECRVRGLACVQGGEPLCGPRAARARARRLYGSVEADVARGLAGFTAASICRTTFSTSSLGHPPQLQLR